MTVKYIFKIHLKSLVHSYEKKIYKLTEYEGKKVKTNSMYFFTIEVES